MKRPPFEIALNDIAQRMGLSPIELLRAAARYRRKSETKVELQPTDEYIEEEYAKAMLDEPNAGAIEDLLKDLLT
jgi:hypothetical protein